MACPALRWLVLVVPTIVEGNMRRALLKRPVEVSAAKKARRAQDKQIIQFLQANQQPVGDDNALIEGEENDSTDPITSAMDQFQRIAVGITFCNCDCCSSQSTTCQKPAGFTGASSGYQCGYSKPIKSDEDSGDKCTERCYPPVAGFARNQETHHGVYCELNCKTPEPKLGEQCLPLTAEETQRVAPTGTGAGNPCGLVAWTDGSEEAYDPTLGLEPLAAGVSAEAAGTQGDTGQQAATAKEAKKEGGAATKKSYEIDLRTLKAKRALADAAAQLTVARSSAERAKYAKARAEAAATTSAAVEATVLKTENVGAETTQEAEALLTAAKEEAAAAQQQLAEAQVLSKKVAGEAAAKAVEKIKAEVTPLAKKLGEIKASMYGWDKPDFWPRVQAAKAADPYLAAMSTKLGEMSLDEAQARTLIQQAIAKHDQAQNLADNVLPGLLKQKQKQVEIAETEHSIHQLKAESEALEGAAKGKYAAAQAARNAVPEFQKQAYQAADNVNFLYTHTFTPPPEVVV